jgi:hypothetical protein
LYPCRLLPAERTRLSRSPKKPWRGKTGMEEFRPKRENRAKAEKK